jgi:hypothetical protein
MPVMRFKRLIIVLIVATSLAVAAVTVTLAGTSRNAASNPSSGDPLTSVTPYQLTQMNLQLDPPKGTPSVSAGAADNVAESVFPDPIIETVSANCTVGSGDVTDSLCWVVSMTPQASSAIQLQGPDGAYDEAHSKTPTVEVVLVNASDGSVLVAFQNGFPPQAPSTTA